MATVTLLNNYPEFAPVLGHWSYLNWYRDRDIECITVMRSYQQRARDEQVPVCYVAIEDTAPVGMVTLKNDDLWSRKDLNPWLASLYVLQDYRRRGIANDLINAVTARAGEMGYKKLYLFLGQEEQDRLETYYKKRGWKFQEEALDNDGLPTCIFYLDL